MACYHRFQKINQGDFVHILIQTARTVCGILASLLLLACSSSSPGTSDAREILTCFVPQENCTQFVVDAIRLGKNEILVQAYNYTSPPILQALANAQTGNRVHVEVILDKSNEQERYTGATYTRNHDIPVFIDDKVAIAHNKVIVIDGLHVLTGSFNFTESAQKRNAENVILIKNDPVLAKRYRENWTSRMKMSREYQGPHQKKR